MIVLLGKIGDTIGQAKIIGLRFLPSSQYQKFRQNQKIGSRQSRDQSDHWVHLDQDD